MPLNLPQDLREFGLRLHLGSKFLIPVGGQHVSLRSVDSVKYEKVEAAQSSPLALRPGVFALGSTVESIELAPEIVGILDGRSTLGRLGVGVHMSSQIVDGVSLHPRKITLELINASPNTVMLYPNDPVAMICFHRANLPADSSLVHGQYHEQDDVTPALAA